MKWLVWMVIFLAVGFVIRQGRDKASLPSGQYRYPPILVIVLVLVGLGYSALAVLVVVSMIQGNPTASTGLAVAFESAGLVSFALAWYLAMERFTANEGGFAYSRVWGSGNFAWREVASVKYSPAWKMLVIKTSYKRITLYPALLQNMPELASLILRQAPPHAIPEQTRGHLAAWSHGALPSVWGG